MTENWLGINAEAPESLKFPEFPASPEPSGAPEAPESPHDPPREILLEKDPSRDALREKSSEGTTTPQREDYFAGSEAYSCNYPMDNNINIFLILPF